ALCVEPRLAGQPQFSCRTERRQSACGRCQSCAYSTHLQHSTQWLNRAGDEAKRRFLTGLLLRCRSLKILENLQNVLQITSGKDFTYSRAQIKAQLPVEGRNWECGDSGNLCGMSMMETWDWFIRSPDWIKCSYLLRLFSLCHFELLHRLGNLVGVLIAREKRGFLHFNTGKHSTGAAEGYTVKKKVILLYIYQYTPTHIHNNVLSPGLLDKATLQHCKRVSQHWCYLTEEVLGEMEVKKMVEKEAMNLDGGSRMAPDGHTGEQLAELNCNAVLWISNCVDERKSAAGSFNPEMMIMPCREDPSRVIHYSGGQMVAVGSKDRAVRLLDVTQIKEVPLLMQGHAGSVRAVLICEERGLIISASYDLSIRCWNLKTGECTMLLSGHMGTITCLDLHEDLLVSGARDCRVKVWSLQSGQCYEKLKMGHRKPVLCVKISASLVLSSCEEGLVKVWETETADLLKIITGHQGYVKCLFFDQWHILSGGADGQVLAWSTKTHFTNSLMTFHHPKEVLTLSFLFLRVITGCLDGKIRIFNFLSGDCLRIIKISTHQSPVLSIHTHDNRLVFTLYYFSHLLKTSLATSKHVNETAVQEYLRKRGLHHPVTTTQVLLKVVRSTQEPHNCDLATSNMNLNAAVRDCWGPPASDPVMEIQTKTPPPPPPPLPPAKTHHRPHSAPKPSNQTSFKGTVKIYTTLRTHPLDLKLRHSLHSREVQSNIPSPTLIRPQTVHEPKLKPKPKPKRPQTVCGTRTVSSFTTTAEEDVQNIHKVFMRSAVKHPGRHVDFEMPGNPRKSHIPLDPFRKHTNFQLKTDSELQELLQSQCTELHHTQNHTHTQNHKEKQRRTAWKLKIKGLPPNDYMKQGQVYAPELGEDIYI
uniref:F-box and WD repeat domain containing 10 n=1 Tax=Astyanax mexicanus TaxID=7994 RepID=A0A3B1JC25_ASTMX